MEFETANRIYCSNATCSAFLYPVNITGDHAQCPICEASTCTICKGPEHDGDCPQDSAVQEVLEMANGQGWRRCPQCKAVVELGTGCNHITCRCKAQWCYLCGAAWRTCQCPQYTPGRLNGALNIAGAELDQAIRLIADLRNRMPQNRLRREPGQEPLPNGAAEGAVGVANADEGAEAARRAADMGARIARLRQAGQDLAGVQRAAERITERQAQLRAQALQLRALGQDPPAGVQAAAEINAEQHAQLRAQLRAQFMQLRALGRDPPAGVERAADPAAERSALRARILGLRRAVDLADPGQLPQANGGVVGGDLDQAIQRARASAARFVQHHRHGEDPLAEVAGPLERVTQNPREARVPILDHRRPVQIDRTRNNVEERRDRVQQQRIEADRRAVERRAQTLRQRDEAQRQIAELRAIAQRPVPGALPQIHNTNQPRPVVQGQPPAHAPRQEGLAGLRAELRQQRERLLRSNADMAIASAGLSNLRNRLTQERESLERPQSQPRELSPVRLPAPTRERSDSLERPLRDPVQSPHRRLIEHRLRWSELRRHRGRTRSLERRRSVSPIARPRQRYDPPSP